MLATLNGFAEVPAEAAGADCCGAAGFDAAACAGSADGGVDFPHAARKYPLTITTANCCERNILILCGSHPAAAASQTTVAGPDPAGGGGRSGLQ